MAKSHGLQHFTALSILISSMPLHASFIEQTLGTAVVNDATAVYFNPAALTLLPQKQLITLGTGARSKFQFKGNVQRPFSLIEPGASTSLSYFYLPSMYFGMPIGHQLAAGLAVVINDFNRELDNYSVLRYVQASNHTDDIDWVPALGVKINEFLSLGGNLNFSRAHFLQEPRFDIASLNIPESRSRNDSRGSSIGWDAGILMKVNPSTTMGLNHRSAIRYHLKGSSILNDPIITLSSENYHFKYWTPARSVFSISHFLNKQFGLIGTIQYLQWNIFKQSTVFNFATRVGSDALIVPQATIYYHFHNSWLLTLGSIYKISPKWIIRMAGTYNQSPSNGQFQIGSGDSYAIGSSMGYKVMKNLTLDCSYAHAFFKKRLIDINTSQNNITGINKGTHDSMSLKLTISI